MLGQRLAADVSELRARGWTRIDLDRSPKTPKAGRLRGCRQSGRPDLNRGLPAPKAGALPGCATPRAQPSVASSARARDRPARSGSLPHRDGDDRAPARAALRPGADRRAPAGCRAAVRRDRRGSARGAGGPVAVQRRRDRPSRGTSPIPTLTRLRCSTAGSPRVSSSAMRNRRSGRSNRITSAPTAAPAPVAASSPGSASSSTARVGSARTSARTRARARTGCG